jgi:hypothetical protein
MQVTIKDHRSNRTSHPVETHELFDTFHELRGPKRGLHFPERARELTEHIVNSMTAMRVGDWTTIHDIDGKPEYTVTAVQK